MPLSLFQYLIAARLRIQIVSASITFDDKGMVCDGNLVPFTTQTCDVYANIKINGELVKSFRTNYKTITAGETTDIGWLYTTPKKIPKDAVIEIGLYDWESYWNDDKLSVWRLPNKQIGQTVTLTDSMKTLIFRTEKHNKITVRSEWL